MAHLVKELEIVHRNVSQAPIDVFPIPIEKLSHPPLALDDNALNADNGVLGYLEVARVLRRVAEFGPSKLCHGGKPCA